LEEPEKVLKEEVAVPELNTELNCNPNESLELLAFLVLKLLLLWLVDLYLLLRLFTLSVHDWLSLECL
jgi:hypothetical protein